MVSRYRCQWGPTQSSASARVSLRSAPSERLRRCAPLALALDYPARVLTPLRVLVPSSSLASFRDYMKIVLQHTKSCLYYVGSGTWTRDLGEAFDFCHSQRAVDFARQQRLTGVHAIVAFID